MELAGFSICNYKPGLEKDQVKIFNKRINDLNPDAQQITVEKVLKRHKKKDFHPEQVKYLVNKNNEILGYVELRILGTTHLIFYPLILKPYNSLELTDYLFKAIYDYSISLKPRSIQGIYNFNFHKVHRYFESQKIAKIDKKYIRTELSIDITKIKTIQTLYRFKNLEKRDIEKVFNFLKLTDSLVKNLPVEQAYELFEDKTLRSSDFYIIFKNNVIVGLGGFGEFESEGKSKEHYAFIEDAIDRKYIEDIEIRKAFLKASIPFLKKKSLNKLNVFVFNPSIGMTKYKELGFQENGYGRNIYSFDTKNLDKTEPFCNF